jgi:hypothetical protein
LASSGVPAGCLLSSPVPYPPGNWKAAANEIVMMSTEAMPMVAVESLIFSASFSSFGCLGSSSSSPRGRKPGLAPAALSRESILTSGPEK